MCFKNDIDNGERCYYCLEKITGQLLSFKLNDINKLVNLVIKNNYCYCYQVNPKITHNLSSSNKFRYVGNFDSNTMKYTKVKEFKHINIENIPYVSYCLCYHYIIHNHYIIDENNLIYVIGSNCIEKFITCIECNKPKTNTTLKCIECKKQDTIKRTYKGIADKIKQGKNRKINKYIKRINNSQKESDREFREKRRLTTINFGKYKGKSFNYVIYNDISYVIWIYSKYILNEHNKNIRLLINYIMNNKYDDTYTAMLIIKDCQADYGIIENGYLNY